MQDIPVGCLESEILGLHVVKALRQQPCCGQQHERKRGLRYDQRFLRPAGVAPRGTSGAAERIAGDQHGRAHVRFVEGRAAEQRAAQGGPPKVRPAQDRPAEVAPDQRGAIEDGPRQVRLGEVAAGKVGIEMLLKPQSTV